MTDETEKERHEREREELFERCLNGQMTPKAAEEEAARRGLEPLAPQPLQQEPTQAAEWTLPMAVAWIAWHDLALVKEAWPKYRASLRKAEAVKHPNHPGTVLGWNYVQPPAMTLEEVRLWYLGQGRDERQAADDALATLWDKLANGALTATAIRLADDMQTEVPAREWGRLRVARSRTHWREVLMTDAASEVYAAPLFLRTDLERLWPAQSEVHAEPEPASVVTPTRDTHGKRVARELLEAAYGSAIPAKNSVKPGHLVAAVLKHHDPKTQGQAPSKETILRVAGWKQQNGQ